MLTVMVILGLIKMYLDQKKEEKLPLEEHEDWLS